MRTQPQVSVKPMLHHGFADDIKAAPYEDTGMTAKYGNGYVSAFCYSEDFDWLFLPGEFNGNTALPVGDHCWNQNGTGWRVATLGACWVDGLGAGAFCWVLYDASSIRGRHVGSRLVYRKRWQHNRQPVIHTILGNQDAKDDDFQAERQ